MNLKYDTGSFRDRSSRVFVYDDQVFRAVNAESLATWRRVSQESFFQEMVAEGSIVRSVEVGADEWNKFHLPDGTAGVLRHERIPFISYPYEWSFAMLRQSALLHLRVLSKAIRTGLILKDASPYNVQFRGSKAVFIDIGSFTELVPGEPWSAYRQFCELMLFPLLLQAYRNVHFQPILRAQLEGVPAKQFLQWIRWRDMLRPGVLKHGWLQAALERKTQSISSSTVRDLQSSGFSSALIEQNIASLVHLIERLEWSPDQTQWTDYNDSLPHVAADSEFKREFVRGICQQKRRGLIWDLGCNDGQYSKIASEYAATVIGMDQDHACVDRLYKSSVDGTSNVLPLCVELANASPGQGWRGAERKRLEERGKPDLIFCLGLIHHLVLAANIPLSEVVDWLASFRAELVIEFPSKKDAMVQALLRNKRDQYEDYSIERLASELAKSFEIRNKESLPSGERTLIYAVPQSLLDSDR